MNTHENAHLTPKGREDMVRAVVEHGLSKAAAARQFNTTPKTVAKWVARFKAEGVVGLRDRSSKPLSSPSQTSLATADAAEALRRQRRTQEHIAGELGISKATVSRILKRRGLSLLSSLEPQQPRPRYERATPGEIIHIDIKKLGRFNAIGHRITGDRRGQSNARGKGAGPGWEFVHVAIDDHSRIGFTDMYPDEGKESAVQFLRNAVAYFASLGVQVKRLLTDNGNAFRAKVFAAACSELGVRHRFTRMYRPQTNGKAERFIRTMLHEWAYGPAFPSSAHRTGALERWLHYYNWHRRHRGLGGAPPISRLVSRDDLLRHHI